MKSLMGPKAYGPFTSIPFGRSLWALWALKCPHRTVVLNRDPGRDAAWAWDRSNGDQVEQLIKEQNMNKKMVLSTDLISARCFRPPAPRCTPPSSPTTLPALLPLSFPLLLFPFEEFHTSRTRLPHCSPSMDSVQLCQASSSAA
jgi:hypothetical protein